MISLIYLVSVAFMYVADWVDDNLLQHRHGALCVWLVVHRPEPFYNIREVEEVMRYKKNQDYARMAQNYARKARGK